ncbi:MAG: hypothetical protein N2318_02860 [Meiothermus sp.]|nr:hypothetical protein [Meiothermus sp.]
MKTLDCFQYKYTPEPLLSRLEGVRPAGPGRWMALCPAHDDRNPSLSILLVESRVLLHCFAGCTPDSVLAALPLGLLGSNEKPPDKEGVLHTN